LGYILGDFSTSSSGHPEQGSIDVDMGPGLRYCCLTFVGRGSIKSFILFNFGYFWGKNKLLMFLRKSRVCRKHRNVVSHVLFVASASIFITLTDIITIAAQNPLLRPAPIPSKGKQYALIKNATMAEGMTGMPEVENSTKFLLQQECSKTGFPFRQKRDSNEAILSFFEWSWHIRSVLQVTLTVWPIKYM
jgi:hypothetical protein